MRLHGPCQARCLGKGVLTTITRDGLRPVKVYVKRFGCGRCGKVFEGKAPFYDGCNAGSPIFDLSLALTASNPHNRVESILMNHGIQVDKCTVKNYALRFRDKVVRYAGIPVMDDSSIGINALKVLFGVETVEELKKDYPRAKYDASKDETYPRVKGAKTMEEEVKKSKYPRSFTLAASYMNHLKCFASLSCREAPFNSIVAEALAKPLKGSDGVVRDGSSIYNGMEGYACLWHRMRNCHTLTPSLWSPHR